MSSTLNTNVNNKSASSSSTRISTTIRRSAGGASEAQLYVSVTFFACVLVLAAVAVAVVIQPTSAGGEQFLRILHRVERQQALVSQALSNVSTQLRSFRKELIHLEKEFAEESSDTLHQPHRQQDSRHNQDKKSGQDDGVKEEEERKLATILSKSQLAYLHQYEKDLGNPIREKVDSWMESHHASLQKEKKALIREMHGDKKEYEDNELDSHKAPVHYTVLVSNMPKYGHKDVMKILAQKCGSVASMRSLEDQLRLTFSEVKGAQCAIDQDGKLEIDGTFLDIQPVDSKAKEESNFKQAQRHGKAAVKYQKVPDEHKDDE